MVDPVYVGAGLGSAIAVGLTSASTLVSDKSNRKILLKIGILLGICAAITALTHVGSFGG